MERWKPSSKPERIVLSNMQYALMKEFYKKGVGFTVSEQEAHFLDQRSFGPAYAKGLFAWDGHVFYMTVEGRQFVEAYEGRTAWKENASREFSHWIKAARTIRSIRKGPGRKQGRARAANA